MDLYSMQNQLRTISIIKVTWRSDGGGFSFFSVLFCFGLMRSQQLIPYSLHSVFLIFFFFYSKASFCKRQEKKEEEEEEEEKKTKRT